MAEYIERDKAIDACFDGWNNNAHDCAENIRAIPAADLRPVVRGKWIYNEEAVMGNPYGSYRCTHCSNAMPHKTNYCPNCGAEMR